MAHAAYYAITKTGIMPTKKPWQGMNWIWPATRVAIYIRDGWRCLYCFRDLAAAPAGMRSLDHLWPRHSGGDHDPRNLITCCLSCNDRRQNKPWRRFATPEARERIQRHRRRKLTRYREPARAHLREIAAAVAA